MQEIAFARARRGVSRLRAAAARTGVASLSRKEIEAEIRASRQP
jgi:hypothetical protein